MAVADSFWPANDHVRILLPLFQTVRGSYTGQHRTRPVGGKRTMNIGDRVALGSHDGASGVMNEAADDAPRDEQVATTEAINNKQNTTCGDEEDDVLNDG